MFSAQLGTVRGVLVMGIVACACIIERNDRARPGRALASPLHPRQISAFQWWVSH